MTISNCDFEGLDDKVKGLADLLWAMAAQIENGSCVRVAGAFMLAQIATDIEDMLNSVAEKNNIVVKGGDVA